MRISSKLRLLSMRNNLQGEVAKIIFDNVDEDTNISIIRFMKDIVNNGCAYSYLKGLQYHKEMQDFYSRNKQDIDLAIFLYETSRNSKLDIAGNKESEHAWFAVEEVVKELMNKLYVK